MRIDLLVWTLAASLIVQLGSDRTAIAQSAVTVQEWTFDTAGNREHWSGASGVTDIVVRDGVLRGVISGRDPFISISDLDIPARPWNVFQARCASFKTSHYRSSRGTVLCQFQCWTVRWLLSGKIESLDRAGGQYLGGVYYLPVLE
ncbi:MAG: hypothetical protein R3C09_13550 [Pirellulaceae bacterium]